MPGMCSYGFQISPADPCLYVMIGKEAILIVVIWVDDLIIAGSSEAVVRQFKEAISGRFNMKDLGALSWILGMEVTRDRSKGTLTITQKAYTDVLLKRFGMTECKPVGTPAEGYLRRVSDGEPNKDYMCLVGSLLYAAMVTRPDISFAVQALGRHLQSSTDEHMNAGMRVLRYLQGTKNVGITYSKGETVLVGYADSDWAGDQDTRRSVTGYVYVLCGAAISWGSKLQPTVALSSSEAEYMAACYAIQEAVHLRLLLKSLGYEQQGHTVIFEDNQGCIYMSQNPVMHKRAKHIDIRFHFVRERVADGTVKLVYVETENQLADLLTKPLLKARILKIRGVVLGSQ